MPIRNGAKFKVARNIISSSSSNQELISFILAASSIAGREHTPQQLRNHLKALTHREMFVKLGEVIPILDFSIYCYHLSLKGNLVMWDWGRVGLGKTHTVNTLIHLATQSGSRE